MLQFCLTHRNKSCDVTSLRQRRHVIVDAPPLEATFKCSATRQVVAVMVLLEIKINNNVPVTIVLFLRLYLLFKTVRK